MPRAALVTLLVAFILVGVLQAQRASASFHGNAAGLGLRSASVAQRGFANGFFPRGGFSSRRFPSRPYRDLGSVFIPYFWPNEDEESYPEGEATEPVPATVVFNTPDRPPAKPHLIEVPGAAASPTAKPLPPAIFILANGERLEARRFLLTATSLSVSIDRQERAVPLNMLDITATIAANRERGFDLRIPFDRNEIVLGF